MPMSVPPKDHPALAGETPRYRPRERFWPYADLPEQLSDEEIAALDPDLHAELFGTPPRPLSITVSFPVLDSADYPRALELAKASSEYRETGSGSSFRHRATRSYGSRRTNEPRALCYAEVNSPRSVRPLTYVTECPAVMQPRRR